MNRKDTGFVRDRVARRDAGGFVESFAKSFVHTEEFRVILYGALPEVLAVWAGQSRIRKTLASIIGRVLAKGFAPRSGFGGSPVVDTCSDPEFQRQAAAHVPGIINAVIAALGAFTRGLSEMPEEERRFFLKAFIENTDMGGIGGIVANLVKSLNMERHDPAFIIEALRPKVRSVLSELDFGEIKEMADASADGIPSLVGMINEELWQYPAKMVCLLSLLPALGNILIRSSVKTLGPINEMPPDLLADVILSLVRDIDGKSIGMAVNQAFELVRKIHTGSALIGDKASHAVPAAVSRLAIDTLGEIDVSLLIKSQGMLRELRDLVRISVIQVLEDNPAIAADFFQSHFRSLVSWVRAWSQKAETFQRVFSDGDIAREFARGMGDLDAQEMAAALSAVCGLFNQVRQLSPGTIKSFLSQFFSALDERVLAETARWLVDDVVQSMKPVAPEIMPPVINGLAELIAPDGEMSDEMKEACDRLRGLFSKGEVSA
ncbi:MAG: hypothetical protein KA369_23795 [Spirochaetes bacterium]|nr:hypothetical protein [Spirochaetota bacterium]